jgi:hypothetical protein
MYYYEGSLKPVIYDSKTNTLLLFGGKTWQPITNFTPSTCTNSDTNLNSCCDTLKSAFLNNDPSSQPVSRAVYMDSSAPSNPVKDMLWFDTSNNILKLYDGNNWQSINDTSDLKNKINTLNSAFISNDPSSQSILRATYVGSSAPSNPTKGTTWLDTSQSNTTIKIYDGSNWQAISGGSGSSNNRVDLTNATSDYNLDVGQEAIINFNNTQNVALHISTKSGTLYNLYIYITNPSFAQGSGGTETPAYLYPNNTSYSNAMYRAGWLVDSKGNTGNASGNDSAFVIIASMNPANCHSTIFNEKTHKSTISHSVHAGGNGNNYARWQSVNSVWNDYSTDWTSLGTINFPISTSGYILVRRVS